MRYNSWPKENQQHGTNLHFNFPIGLYYRFRVLYNVYTRTPRRISITNYLEKTKLDFDCAQSHGIVRTFKQVLLAKIVYRKCGFKQSMQKVEIDFHRNWFWTFCVSWVFVAPEPILNFQASLFNDHNDLLTRIGRTHITKCARAIYQQRLQFGARARDCFCCGFAWCGLALVIWRHTQRLCAKWSCEPKANILYIAQCAISCLCRDVISNKSHVVPHCGSRVNCLFTRAGFMQFPTQTC